MEELSSLIELKEKLEALKTDLLSSKELEENQSFEDKLNLLYDVEEELNKVNEKISDLTFMCEDNSAYELLQEANIRKLDQKTQRNLRKIFIAISLAKKAQDPLYNKYAKGVMLRKTYKDLILKKYGNKAYQLAMAAEHMKK